MSVAVPFKKNSQTKKNYTKTATFPTAILLVAVLQPYNLYQHLQFPSLSIGNCGSPNLRCGPAVPSSLDSSPLLRCCLALCCSASVELGSTSSCKKAGKAIWMTTTFSNLKTKEVFSSKWDFEQQLQMCMYIYSMHNYILLHTITYSYIYITRDLNVQEYWLVLPHKLDESKIWRVGTFGTALRFPGLRNLVASPELSIKCRHLCQWSSSYPWGKSQCNAAPIQQHSNITSFARTHCKSEILLQEIGHLQHLRFII